IAEYFARYGVISPPQLSAMELFNKGKTAYDAKDYAEAMRSWRLAAEQGVAVAMASIGNLYFQGAGVPQDFAEAFRWVTMAAEKGDAAAMGMVGVHYAGGRGVAKDYSAAMAGESRRRRAATGERLSSLRLQRALPMVGGRVSELAILCGLGSELVTCLL